MTRFELTEANDTERDDDGRRQMSRRPGPVQARIARTYASWTVVLALRSGAPIKSRKMVYPLLAKIPFDDLFDHSLGQITSEEFERWHRRALDRVIELGGEQDRVIVHGWAAKIVNVYLKTRGYVSRMGRTGLKLCLHPPLDAELWLGLKRRFAEDPEMCVMLSRAPETIGSIDSHEAYESAIRICAEAARRLSCSLIEVEQVWLGATAGDVSVTHKFVRPPATGSRVWLWDYEVDGEVRGTVTGYANDHLVVDVAGGTVYLYKSISSRVGRWLMTRTEAGDVLLDGAEWGKDWPE